MEDDVVVVDAGGRKLPPAAEPSRSTGTGDGARPPLDRHYLVGGVGVGGVGAGAALHSAARLQNGARRRRRPAAAAGAGATGGGFRPRPHPPADPVVGGGRKRSDAAIFVVHGLVEKKKPLHWFLFFFGLLSFIQTCSLSLNLFRDVCVGTFSSAGPLPKKKEEILIFFFLSSGTRPPFRGEILFGASVVISKDFGSSLFFLSQFSRSR